MEKAGSGSIVPPVLQPPVESSPPPESINLVSFRIGWILFVLAAALGITLLLSVKVPLGMLVLGLDIVYLGTCLHEVRSPNVAMLFRMGKFIGRLDPGWYLTIPHFWDIKVISAEWQSVEIEGGMYAAEKTDIHVKATIFYRALEGRLTDILRMMPEEMVRRAEVISLALLRGAIGAKKFEELIKEKGEIEDALLIELQGEFTRYGYQVRDVEIYDFDEKVQSRAEQIRILGEARGKAAAALAEPLKDNWPASVAGSVAEIAPGLVEAIKNFLASKRETTKAGGAPKEKSSEGGPASATLSGIERLARRAEGRR